MYLINRFVLNMTLPGGACTRNIQDLMIETYGVKRSIGYISEFINEKGQKAKKIREGIDWSNSEELVISRGETFFNSLSILMTVDLVSPAIFKSYVSTDYSALTWATVLLVQEDKGLRIKGLTKDCAKAYPLSLEEVELGQPVQKDIRHVYLRSSLTYIFI